MEKSAQTISNDKIWTKHFTSLILSLLLLSCSNYYMMSSISEYADILGGLGFIIGLVTSSFFIGSLIMRFILGQMVQKFGSYKMMIIAVVICIFACFGHFFCRTHYVNFC